jgi:hypothetical protein
MPRWVYAPELDKFVVEPSHGGAHEDIADRLYRSQGLDYQDKVGWGKFWGGSIWGGNQWGEGPDYVDWSVDYAPMDIVRRYGWDNLKSYIPSNLMAKITNAVNEYKSNLDTRQSALIKNPIWISGTPGNNFYLPKKMNGGWYSGYYDPDSQNVYIGDKKLHHQDVLAAMKDQGIIPHIYQPRLKALTWLNRPMADGQKFMVNEYTGEALDDQTKDALESLDPWKNPRTAATLSSPDEARSRVASGQHQAFGYVDGQLYFGQNHSNITSALIDSGWSWEELVDPEQVPQLWGWISKNAAPSFVPTKGLNIRFVSDMKFDQNQSKYLEEAATQALYDWWLGPVRTDQIAPFASINDIDISLGDVIINFDEEGNKIKWILTGSSSETAAGFLDTRTSKTTIERNDYGTPGTVITLVLDGYEIYRDNFADTTIPIL